MRSGIVGEKDNLVTMHDILDAQWVYDNTKVTYLSTRKGGLQPSAHHAQPVAWTTLHMTCTQHRLECTGSSSINSLQYAHTVCTHNARGCA